VIGSLVVTALAGRAAADEGGVRPERPRIEAATTVFASSYPDEDGEKALAYWVGLRPRVEWTIARGWQLAAVARDPRDLAGDRVAITIEPEPDDSPAPCSMVLLGDAIEEAVVGGQTYVM
jgi:hypothetical protein